PGLRLRARRPESLPVKGRPGVTPTPAEVALRRSVVGAALLAGTALLLGGCGTLRNHFGGTGGTPGGEKRVYGGVLLDAAVASQALRGTKSLPDGIFAAADLPTSAVADTLLLPWTLRAARRKGAAASGPALGVQQEPTPAVAPEVFPPPRLVPQPAPPEEARPR